MPQCGYCRDCKWWTKQDTVIDEDVTGDCNNEVVIDAFGDDYYPPSTGAEFGCILFAISDAGRIDQAQED